MIEKIIDRIGYQYPLKEKDIDEFKTFKAGYMNNECEAYEARNLGSIFAMRSKGFLGLMKMETLIICPVDIDGPLFSLDIIRNRNVYLEVIDVMLGKSFSEDRMNEIKKNYQKYIDDHQKARWYDNIRLESSMLGKFPDDRMAEECLMNMTEAYLRALDFTHVCYSEDKKAKIREYSDQLLQNGGPSTDYFIKHLGKEKTERFFNEAMFLTK